MTDTAPAKRSPLAAAVERLARDLTLADEPARFAVVLDAAAPDDTAAEAAAPSPRPGTAR